MINRVVVVGRLTKDLVLRKTQTGASVLSCTLAVNRRIKQEGQPEADFVRCVAWNKTAEVMAEYLSKGAQIGIEGRIQTGSYKDRDGKTVYTTDVVIDNVQFLEPKKPVASSYQPASVATYPTQESGYGEGFGNNPLDIASDDLPF